MMTTLVASESITIENSPIEFVERYVYLGHEMKLTRSNQTYELLKTGSLGWEAFGKM